MVQKKIKTLLVDDDATIRSSFRKLLVDNFPQIEISGEAENVPNAVKLIHQLKPDLLFLDIDMPGHSGLELPDFFAKDAIDFSIVFVTAFSDYAINAFELSAIDYILKPAGVEQVSRALAKLHPFNISQFQTLKENFTDASNPKVAIPTSNGLLFIHFNDILYLKADGSYTHFHFADGTTQIVSKKLTEYVNFEKTGIFMRIHRSHSINLNHIKKLEKGSTPCVTMSDGATLSIATERRQALYDYVDGFRI